MAISEWRKRKGPQYDSWHFCRNCKKWPTPPTQYEVRYTKPTSGEFCNECKAKQAAGNCS